MLTGFDYHRPSDEPRLRSLLDELDDLTLLAGGTDVLVQMRSGRIKPRHLVDLTYIDSLRRVGATVEGGFHIGATASVREVIEHPYVAKHFSALAEGGREVGSIQNQNRATLVGNICNASPAADSVPGLLIFDASLRITGREDRLVPLRGFFLGPGECELQPGDWVRGIDIPAPTKGGSCYLKLGRTRGVDLAIVGVACRVSATDASMSFASVAPTPLYVDLTDIQDVESYELQGESLEVIRSVIRPIDDLRASAVYREEMAIVLARRAWRLARSRLNDGARQA
jgi:CO/xanthine dehydrogenase FAD-binding subunit